MAVRAFLANFPQSVSPPSLLFEVTEFYCFLSKHFSKTYMVCIKVLDEDFLASQSSFEMTNVSATPSGLVHCEEVKSVT